MVTTIIGKKFLDAYNSRENSSYDSRSFFIEKYFPMFFDSDKYMQWVQNSPFVQMKKGQKVENLSSSERREKLDELIHKIDDGARDASVAIGYSAADNKEYATTSGQITNIEIPIPADDVYLSWIGSSLGVGVQGGYSILFMDAQILLDIFDGWSWYRKVLNNYPGLKGNQISSWNGQWLCHRYDSDFDAERPMASFSPYEKKNGTVSISTQSWSKILINIAKKRNGSNLMGYIYSLGQMNTTIGFIPFNLEQVKRPSELYRRYYGGAGVKAAEELFGTAFGFEAACRAGAIGISAMEPKGIRDYIFGKNEKIKSPSAEDMETDKFHTFLIWILAMLNNEELWTKSTKFAQALRDYALSSSGGKTDKSNKVKALLATYNKKNFIGVLTDIVSDAAASETMVEMASLINSMPNENVPFFITLVKFNYVSLCK